jgi:hypothetical protein
MDDARLSKTAGSSCPMNRCRKIDHKRELAAPRYS